MKYGFFDSSELQNPLDRCPSPYGEMRVQSSVLVLINCIRSAFGKPLIVNSGYRSQGYNLLVGGAENSYHVKGLACDLRPKDLKDLRALQELCDKLNQAGGVGFYDTFVHVDARGTKARWDLRTRK